MDYFDLPTDVWQQARRDNQIPNWFTRISVTQEWKNSVKYSKLDISDTTIQIEMRYFHEGDICYQIREYIIYDWMVTYRSGTVYYLLSIDTKELEAMRTFAVKFLIQSTMDAVRDYFDPSSTVAAGLEDIGLILGNSVLPPIIADLVQGINMTELLDQIVDISDKVRRRMEEINRLIRLNKKVVSEYENVLWREESTRVITFSSIEVVQIECTDWILEIPEGEVIHVPDHTEHIYPLPPLDEKLENELKEIRKAFDKQQKTLGIGVIKSIIDTPYIIEASSQDRK